MNTNKPGPKETLRARMRAIVKGFSAEKRQKDSDALCSNLKARDFFQNAGSLLFFASLPDEPDLWPLLETALAKKKLAALPCFDGDNQTYLPRRVTDLRVEILCGPFGIREPSATCVDIPLEDLDLALVPGVAFDLAGRRLGRGKGFYDRLLENFTGKKIGVAFDEQVAEAVPAEKNDVRMDFIVTPTRCVKCSP